MTTDNETGLEPCPLCCGPLTQLANGFAYCRSFAKEPRSHEEWMTKSCLMAQRGVQLPIGTWRALNTRVSSTAPAGDDDMISRSAAIKAIEKNYIDLGPTGSSRYEKGGAYNNGIHASASAVECLPAAASPASPQEDATSDSEPCPFSPDSELYWPPSTPSPADAARNAAQEIVDIAYHDKGQVPHRDTIAAIISKYLPAGSAHIASRRCVKCGHFETVDLHDEGECQVRGQSGFICGCKCEFPAESVGEG